MLKKDLLKAAQPFCDVSFTIVSYKYGINCFRITGQLYVCQSLNFVKNVFSLLFSEAFLFYYIEALECVCIPWTHAAYLEGF